MTQDFAKIRPEPLLERKQVAPPPAWSLMITGGLVGLVIGVFASFMFYLSGNVPPLTNTPPPVVASTTTVSEPPPEEIVEERVNFEFYTALPDYEVQVNATPVPVGRSDQPRAGANPPSGETAVSPAGSAAINVVLQSGAFQQQELATAEMYRQQSLGLNVRVRQESSLPGRTLYLVQSGPYTTQQALSDAEQILRRSNIQSLRTSPR